MSTVIKVENLGKSYVLGSQKNSKEDSLRDVITEKVKGAFRNTKSLISKKTPNLNSKPDFWAFKDVNFEVKQGERIGIIGRNGAGKSTLLKLLSRITEPTRGRISINGRVASLLEVGTGFHPELSGRENIYLNGAILGMHRAEIKRKFDEIVDFSEVEKFLDTPVKRYSSGMYVRLAFAVAAYLESENLVVDEVLAVGDAQFQKKCLGKMDEVSRREGRTVLFVSHNLAAISELTNRTLVFDSGHVVADGTTTTAIAAYLSRAGGMPIYAPSPGKTTSDPHVSYAEVVTSDGNGIHRFGEPLEVRFRIKHDQIIPRACLAFRIMNQFQERAIYAWAYPPEIKFGAQTGETILTCRFPSLRLNVGKFYLRVTLDQLGGGRKYEDLDGICPFEVIRSDPHRWEWWPEACTYHEDWSWTLNATPPPEK